MTKLLLNSKPSPVRLTRGGASAAGAAGQVVRQAQQWRESYNPLRQLTIARAVELIERAQRGDFALPQWTYRTMERRYPTLSALIRRTEAPIKNFDWSIQVLPLDQLPAGATPELAAAQRRALRAAYEQIDNLRAAIRHLAHADYPGYAHCQKHRAADGRVSHLECLYPWCFTRAGLDGDWFWNPDSLSVGASPAQTLGEQNRIAGDAAPGPAGAPPLPRADFLIREVPMPIDEAALILFVRSSLCERDWDAFIEIIGLPSGVVTMPANVPPGKESEYESAAVRIAEGGSGAIPYGASYTPNDTPRAQDPFTPRLSRLDQQLIMVGTGGKLTMLAESGSGTLAGGAHENSLREIAADRAGEVSEVFQRDFDREVLAAQFPGQPALAYFQLAARDHTDTAALCADVATLHQAGKTVSTAWLAEKTGYEFLPS